MLERLREDLRLLFRDAGPSLERRHGDVLLGGELDAELLVLAARRVEALHGRSLLGDAGRLGRVLLARCVRLRLAGLGDDVGLRVGNLDLGETELLFARGLGRQALLDDERLGEALLLDRDRVGLGDLDLGETELLFPGRGGLHLLERDARLGHADLLGRGGVGLANADLGEALGRGLGLDALGQARLGARGLVGGLELTLGLDDLHAGVVLGGLGGGLGGLDRLDQLLGRGGLGADAHGLLVGSPRPGRARP